MMTWNYRVFREDDGDYVIREVFYAEDGAIITCTVDPVEPFGSSLEELAQSIEDFKAALVLPVLTMGDIPEATSNTKQQRGGKTISHDELLAQMRINETPQQPAIKKRIQAKKAS